MTGIAAAAAKELANEGLKGIYRHMGAGIYKFNVSGRPAALWHLHQPCYTNTRA